ncbi:MAG TPA: hypothetical protein VH158_09665 [Gemmatimonadales bacterium]|jgi:hypothetical protein|nr:hypothetical protein [Gemmatimonadales bacterium]
MPDTLACDHAVMVRARSEAEGIAAERTGLDAVYPDHSGGAQALQFKGSRRYDLLFFTRANGREASVCFDITDFFGQW